MDATVRSINTSNYKKNIKYNIELILKPIAGDKPTTNTGLVDTRLFKGENKLWAIMDTQTCLWYLKYDSGLLPEPLKQRWTGLAPLLSFVKNYFKKRNIEIVEMID